MKTIYLYVKTHQKTGFKYLGKTIQNPHRYKGSGIDWLTHLKEHGNLCSTEILKECKDNTELNYWGRHYSKLWNVVESTEWANRIPETGGGCPHIISEEQKQKISQKLKGHSVAEETRKKISKSGIGRIAWNKGLKKEDDTRIAKQAATGSKSMKGRIPWNKGKTGAQVAWNKGLTKETDNRVAKYAEELSVVNKGIAFRKRKN